MYVIYYVIISNECIYRVRLCDLLHLNVRILDFITKNYLFCLFYFGDISIKIFSNNIGYFVELLSLNMAKT